MNLPPTKCWPIYHRQHAEHWHNSPLHGIHVMDGQPGARKGAAHMQSTCQHWDAQPEQQLTFCQGSSKARPHDPASTNSSLRLNTSSCQVVSAISAEHFGNSMSSVFQTAVIAGRQLECCTRPAPCPASDGSRGSGPLSAQAHRPAPRTQRTPPHLPGTCPGEFPGAGARH